MKVSDYIVQRVYQAGIRDVFCVNGGGAMHLDDSFGHCKDIRVTYHHHEQACAMAAEAYARVSNKPALVLVTSGPGAVNALTGVLCAWMESIPMIIISGQARYETLVRSTNLELRSMGIQEFDITKAAKHMTKFAEMVEDEEDVRVYLEEALCKMMHGRRGPVWLDIPLDVQAAEINPGELRGWTREDLEDLDHDLGRNLNEPEEVEENIRITLARLDRAERPVLFGGFGVRASGGIKEFRTLAELLGIPVLNGMSSQDLIPDNHWLFAGRTGMTGSRCGNLAMAGCDLFLSIGSRLSFLQTGFNYQEWARGAYVIMNELDSNECLKPNIRFDLLVLTDARYYMRGLIRELRKRGATPEHPYCEAAAGWLLRCMVRKKMFPAVTARMKGPQPDGLCNLYAFFDALSDEPGNGNHILCSCGASRFAGTQAFRVREGQRFYTNSATASMGYDLPPGIGLARATGEPVTVVTGEGSLMMNLQEMQTIRTNRLPIRVFVICNGGYHSIKQTQMAWFGEPYVGIGPESGDLEFPDPEKLAGLFGFSYGKCSSNETLKSELHNALKLPLPALIEVRVSPLQGTEPKAASRKLADGTMVSSPLEDMAPFLDRNVLREQLEIPLTESEARR